MIDINLINEVAVEAGKKVMEIYEDFLNVRYKEDNTPVTDADIASNDIIINYLQKYYSDIPIISEEINNVEYDIRKYWEYYFCVDPLDGTKEFIKKSGQFSINIALIKNGNPIAGVIYSPSELISHFSDVNQKVFKKHKDKKKEELSTKYRKENLVLIKSNSDKMSLAKHINLPISEEKHLGSALKFCKIAEGEANVYVRFGPTMEWDTAAGQAIVEATGGVVFANDNEKNKLIYNKENLENPNFICIGGVEF